MRDVLFMGDILASVTHEMQNVMAIIKESGALADDILSMNGPPRMKYGDKLAEALQHIQEQVRRGRDLMLMLNGFAHAAADYPETSDIVRFARQITILAERMVRMGECALNAQLDCPPLPVYGNALMLMQSLYLGLAAVLEGCRAHDTINLELVPGSGAACVAGNHGAMVRITALESRHMPDVNALLPVMAELQGRCHTEEGLLLLCYAPPGEERSVVYERV